MDGVVMPGSGLAACSDSPPSTVKTAPFYHLITLVLYEVKVALNPHRLGALFPNVYLQSGFLA